MLTFPKRADLLLQITALTIQGREAGTVNQLYCNSLHYKKNTNKLKDNNQKYKTVIQFSTAVQLKRFLRNPQGHLVKPP